MLKSITMEMSTLIMLVTLEALRFQSSNIIRSGVVWEDNTLGLQLGQESSLGAKCCLTSLQCPVNELDCAVSIIHSPHSTFLPPQGAP